MRIGGGLIALYLYGSYEEMGCQETRLLGRAAIDAETLYGDHWKGLLARMGVGVKIANALWLPVLSWTGPLYEQSGMFAESVGISKELGISRTDSLVLEPIAFAVHDDGDATLVAIARFDHHEVG